MSFNPIATLTPEQLILVEIINTEWTREQTLERLKRDLQIAVEIELSTIPIYLYTYYSINRQPSQGSEALKLFANKAGGTIMSVAVEEMLHMSLASNLLFSLGVHPKMYGKSPNFLSQPSGGTNLPHHKAIGPDGKPIAINLDKLNYDTLWGFLEIEYPKPLIGSLKDENWSTIGEFYAYIHCLIASDHITDTDFQVGNTDKQLSNDYYSQNCIDTIYPKAEFNKSAVPMAPLSAASVAVYPNSGDSHAGYVNSSDNDEQLNKVHDKASAIQAISTICDQGEGLSGNWPDPTQKTDDGNKTEESHYYKFLELQSTLAPYTPCTETLPSNPQPPPAATPQWSESDMALICYPYPKSPTTLNYPEPLRLLSDLCNGVYQYLYLMSETSFTVSGATQVELFNVGVHKAMIWILDKLIQAMRNFTFTENGVKYALAPTFENIDITSAGRGAKSAVLDFAQQIITKAAAENEAQKALPNSYFTQMQALASNNIVTLIRQLPDIALLGDGEQLTPVEVKHACMGLNACKGQGRKLKPSDADNECAGQGACYTSNTHSCHTLNDCKHQGGCGLYGTSKEQSRPGGNQCKGHGSCATPINAERFATADGVAGQSVWQLARKAFEQRMAEECKTFGSPPDSAYQTVNGEKVAVGPSYDFIQANGCVTACGASGMSGAGSCGG